jgi:hypothetical protein
VDPILIALSNFDVLDLDLDLDLKVDVDGTHAVRRPSHRISRDARRAARVAMHAR